MTRWIGCLMAALLLATSSASLAQDKGTEWGEDEIVSYLGDLISLHRDAASIDTTGSNAREMLLQDAIVEQTTSALQSGFAFARAAAPVIDAGRDLSTVETGDAAAQARQQKFNAMVLATDQDVARLKQKIAALPRHSDTASQREQVNVELTFALARQKLFQTVKSNVGQAGLGSGNGLAGKIENLARTVPEVALKPKNIAIANPVVENTPATKATPPAVAQETPRASQGIFSIASALYAANREQTALREYETRTQTLIDTNRSLLANLRVSLDNAAQQGTQLAGVAQDAAARAEHRATLETLIDQFNQVSDSVVPLVKAMRWLDTTKRTVGEWRQVLDKQLELLTRQLLLRLAILAMAVAVPLLLSEVARRAIQRYARDPRRKRQLHTARRIVTGVIVFMVVVMNFISEFGSFMTFAGFITAGLAVALQSVLLSLVAHFFFYGRYGVRAGDLITVANVTGEILQIGMMRLYLREMERDEQGQWVPSGKMVAFPNSILFQPTAFYKHVEYLG